MDLLGTIQQLYDIGIECGLETAQDAGIAAWVGNSYSGRVSERWFLWEEVQEVAQWLDAEARRLYPASNLALDRLPLGVVAHESDSECYRHSGTC
jgi:hypothetical protein